MTKWIKFNLKRGKTESGVQLLDAKLMADIHRVTTAQPSALSLVKPTFPVSDITLGYGYGWEVSEYRGIGLSRVYSDRQLNSDSELVCFIF